MVIVDEADELLKFRNAKTMKQVFALPRRSLRIYPIFLSQLLLKTYTGWDLADKIAFKAAKNCSLRRSHLFLRLYIINKGTVQFI